MPPRVRIVKSPDADTKLDVFLNRAIRHVADEIAADAQRYAPVDTGELVNSIHVHSETPRTARISAEAPHAHFVEFGTENMEAQPFMRPALYQKRNLR